MRKIQIVADPDVDLPDGTTMADWKDGPEMVLAEVDEQLAPFGLEVVIFETGGDSVLWNIEKRNAQ